MATGTVSATKSKANDLDHVGNRQIDSLSTTKHSKVAAAQALPASGEEAVRQLHGFMRGSVIIPDGFDLTEPVLQDWLDVERGALQT